MLAQAIVFVKDVERMQRFYTDGFGVAAVEQSPGWVKLASGAGAALALHAIPAHIAEHIEITDPPRERSETAIKLSFHVDEVEAARARLIALGARMRDPWMLGDRPICDGIDPEGNVFQIATR